jgi:23S rRNA (adenine1618-N6)-methyltransferase
LTTTLLGAYQSRRPFSASTSSTSSSRAPKKPKKLKKTKQKTPIPKHRTHPRNAFQGSYDMERLCLVYPSLAPFLMTSPYAKSSNSSVTNSSDASTTPPPPHLTIRFDDPLAVRTLNAALLAADYHVTGGWQDLLPPYALTPPIPGRADYVHYAADVLAASWGRALEEEDVTTATTIGTTDPEETPPAQQRRTVPHNNVPRGPAVRCLDIGTGASLVYPLLGHAVYGWSFVASEVHNESLVAATAIATANGLGDVVDIRRQTKRTRILAGLLNDDSNERIAMVLCNPPFYESREAFDKESTRKVQNLARAAQRNLGNPRPTRRSVEGNMPAMPRSNTNATATPAESDGTSNNFGGLASELWYPGGEVAFISTMMDESRALPRDQCLWVSSLVSRQDHLPRLQARLRELSKQSSSSSGDTSVQVRDTRVVIMGQGRKSAAILFWSFHNRDEQKAWCERQGWDV